MIFEVKLAGLKKPSVAVPPRDLGEKKVAIIKMNFLIAYLWEGIAEDHLIW
jgi:hypothetical protein